MVRVEGPPEPMMMPVRLAAETRFLSETAVGDRSSFHGDMVPHAALRQGNEAARRSTRSVVSRFGAPTPGTSSRVRQNR